MTTAPDQTPLRVALLGGGVGQQDDELVAPHTRHQIGIKHRLGFGVSDENKVVTGALPFGEGAPGKVCPG